jgi:type I restriction enzyme, S subunit
MSELKNIPRLRFPEFEKEWDEKLFSDFYDFQTTNSYSRDKLNFEYGTIKNIHYGDIHTKFRSQFIVNSEDVPFINDDIDTSKIKTDQFLKEGDLVIADASEDYSDIGKSIEIVDINNQKVVAGLHTLHAKSKKKIYVGFGGFMMKSPSVRKSLMMIAQGTKVLGISSKRVSEININTPSLPEQQKIADFLTAVDKRIELLEKKRTLLETYKKGVMKKIFDQEIRFKDDNGNDFPDWEEKKLGLLLKHVSKRNKSLIVDLVLSVSNTRGFITQNEQFDKHRVASKDVSNYKVVRKNQFGYNPSRINVGSIALLKEYEVGIVSPMYVIFQTKEELDSNYLEYLTLTHLFRHYVNVGCSGSVRDSLNFDEMEKFKFHFPSLIEQQKISNFLLSLDKQLRLLNNHIYKSKTWKKGLLQKMFV